MGPSGEHCQATVRGRGPCTREVLPGRTFCFYHARGSGAPKGNQNARKHGIYSRTMLARRARERAAMQSVTDIDQEIAYLRIAMADGLRSGASLNSMARALNALIRALKARERRSNRSVFRTLQRFLDTIHTRGPDSA